MKNLTSKILNSSPLRYVVEFFVFPDMKCRSVCLNDVGSFKLLIPYIRDLGKRN